MFSRYLNHYENYINKEGKYWEERESLLKALVSEKDEVVKAKDGELEMEQKYFDHLANAIIQHAPQEEECVGYICKIIEAVKCYWSCHST